MRKFSFLLYRLFRNKNNFILIVSLEMSDEPIISCEATS